MGDMVEQIFSSFSDVISSLATGIKDAFTYAIYVDPTAETLELSALAQFGLIFMGISLAIGITWGAFKLLKH